MAGRDVFVVGAGNSAGQAALHLARNARHVTLVVRRDNLPHSMSDYLIKEIEATPVITVRLETEVIEAHGGDRLDGLTLRDKRTGRAERVPADALFVLIGGEPCTQWLPKAVQLEGGYILTLETSVPGVFAVGDVRYRSIKRVASAVGDGATAVRIAHEYLAADEG
jgi:thioredoxin reductase (NADPH)